MKLTNDVMSGISIITGTFITVVISGIFQYKAPFIIPIVIGAVVSCNIARNRFILIGISVALISNVILFLLSLSITAGMEYWKSELMRYFFNILIALGLGYAYSRKSHKG